MVYARALLKWRLVTTNRCGTTPFCIPSVNTQAMGTNVSYVTSYLYLLEKGGWVDLGWGRFGMGYIVTNHDLWDKRGRRILHL